MYIFKNSFLRASNSISGYTDVNLTNLKMFNVLNDYVDGYIVLTHTHLMGTFYLELSALRGAQLPLDTNMTFNEWLSHNYSRELPTASKKPSYIQNEVIYTDAFFGNFTVNRVAEHKPVNANVSDADRVNLLIQKNIPNPKELYRRTLVSVNGFMHRTEPSEGGINVVSGGNTFNNTNVNTVGIISFANCCDLRQRAIEVNMITPTTSTNPLYHELLIHLSEPLTDKSIMISIGGHLFVSKGVCEIVNHEAGIVLVKLHKLDIVSMLLNSVRKIDLGPLGVFASSERVDYNKVRVEDILSDVCIKKYMTLPQSFIIIADAICVQTKYHDLDITGLPGTYETSREPTAPMINSQGQLCEYWKIRQSGNWIVKLADDVTKRYIGDTNIDTNNVIVNSINPTGDWYHDDPKLMQIITTSKY